ncbi:hypothetical protein NECID01_0948 [Nematocida sp. AWRm77]|nr:hypothetical protein NECID01_0948 [Nematocida sp. AWRm77]
MDGSADEKTLAHFLENRNFASTKKTPKKKKVQSTPAEAQDSLAIVDGKIVINEAPQEREVLVEDRVTSFSYGKPYTKRTRWSKEETLLFYKALSLCGTDFTLLEKIFTDKDRKQLKNKFTREEKLYPARISQALKVTKRFSKEEMDALRKEYIQEQSSEGRE